MLPARITDRIDRSAGPDACWPWRGTHVRGRAQTSVGSKRDYVARLVLADSLGRPLVPGAFACHHCDNPSCCNPVHIYEGTPLSNVTDMWARGRAKSPMGPGTRPDVRARHLREKEARTGFVTVHEEDWRWFQQELEAATSDLIRRFVARVERGDGIAQDTEWLDEPSVAVTDAADRRLLFWDRVA